MAVGRRKPDTRAVGDTALVTTGSTAPTAAAGQAAIILTIDVVGERDDGDDHPIEHQAAATQPPSLSMVHALERFTEGKRRARTRSPELEEGFADAVPGSKKSVGPHL
jgi:hypothetical protein